MFDTPEDARAAFKRGLIMIRGESREPSAIDFEIGRDLITKAAQTFPPAAAFQAALDALHIGGTSRDAQTAETFLIAAMSGFPPAIRGLGAVLLNEPETASMGAGMMRQAAQGGDWVAAFLILRESLRGRALARPDELAALSAQMSDAVPLKADIMAGVAALTPNQDILNPAPFVRAVCEAALIDALGAAKTAAPAPLCDHPNVTAFQSVLSPLECDYLIAISSSLMQPSKVVDAEDAGAVSAQYRTSDGAVLLPAHIDLPAIIIARKLARAAGIAPEHGEFISLLRYGPGQEYLPHHDFLKPDAQDYSRVKSCGQRHRTLLTYLNSEYEGGQTAFPKLDIQYRGDPGDSLRFDNVDVQSVPIQNSLHAGMPVTSGEKWLATLWCREKPFWPWMRGS